jgi:hypothetical protein
MAPSTPVIIFIALICGWVLIAGIISLLTRFGILDKKKARAFFGHSPVANLRTEEYAENRKRLLKVGVGIIVAWFALMGIFSLVYKNIHL